MLSIREKAAITSFCQNSFVSEHHNNSERNPSALCFGPLAKKFMDKREGGVSIFSDENFLSHIAEIFCRETRLCIRKFLVSNNVRDKGAGGYHDVPSNLFFLRVP